MKKSLRVTRMPAPMAVVMSVWISVTSAATREDEAQKIVPLTVSGHNRAVEVTVHSVARVDTWLGSRAPRGKNFIVIHTLWENVLSPDNASSEEFADAYGIPSLRDHVYCVVNERRLLSPVNVSGPGMLSPGPLRLPTPGSSAVGHLAFEIPEATVIQSAALRIYDFAHGPIVLPLIENSTAAESSASILPRQHNEIAEFGFFGIEPLAELGSETVPPGMEFVRLDLRARSLLKVEVDATAFDPEAASGSRTRVGTWADWEEWKKHSAVLVDGEYAYPIHDSTDFPKSIRLLPNVMIGGDFYALVPKTRDSLELRCDFPRAHVVSTTEAVRPAPIQFLIEGEAPVHAEATPLGIVDDGDFRVTILEKQLSNEVSGRRATPKTQFLTIAVSVENNGEYGEFFQPRRQLKFVGENDDESEMLPLSESTPHASAPLLWVPAGTRRRFQSVYRIPHQQRSRRLVCRGTTVAKVIRIDAGAPATESRTGTRTETLDVRPLETRPTTLGSELVRVKAKQPRKPMGLASVGLSAGDIDRVIAQGRKFLWEWLKKEIQDRGQPLGHGQRDVLIALALVRAEAHREFTDFDVALRECLEAIRPHRLARTYTAGMFCMLVEAYGDRMFTPRLEHAARYLLESQGPQGSWTYTAELPDEIYTPNRVASVLEVRGGRALDGSNGDSGSREARRWYRMRSLEDGKEGDNSVSQYAVLGLHTASRFDISLPNQVWQRALGAFEIRQTQSGGWSYDSRETEPYGSMTCAGICSRAIGRYQLGILTPLEDEGIELALGWLERNFAVTHNPPSAAWHYYYLAALERLGRILDTEFIGKHEWYPAGARYLADSQAKDGSWQGQGQEEAKELATSFALLFLTRATSSLEAPPPRRGGEGRVKTRAVSPLSNHLYVILDASASMRDKVGEKEKFEIARSMVTRLVQALPEKTRFGLRVYGHHRYPAEERTEEQTENVIAVSQLQRKSAVEKLEELHPGGGKPIALSLLASATDLEVRSKSRPNPTMVVLLTDGGEDSQSQQDAIEAARQLGALENMSLYIVGFHVERPEWTQQLSEMTEAAGGHYLPAEDADMLHDQLLSVVFRRPQTYRIVDASGQPVESAPFGDSVTLREGKYRLTTAFGGKEYASDLWVNTDETTTVLFNADSAESTPDP